MTRELILPGIGNARELGGLHAKEGIVKKGCLLRTAAINVADGSSLVALADRYHVSEVIDFRMSIEQNILPDPKIAGAVNHHLPVMELDETPGFDPEMMKEYLNPGADELEVLIKALELGFIDYDLYVFFLENDRGKNAYKEFFRILLELPEKRAVLWHCKDGKDRTGVAAMLILSALGVSRDLIIEDYMITNQYNTDRLNEVNRRISEYKLTDEEKELIRFGMGGVSRVFMENAMNWMDKNYGSAGGYLNDELGVGRDELGILRNRYLA